MPFFFARARLWLGCRATGESILEEFLCFGVVAALILARPAGPLHWRCIFGWLPKLYHHYGLQGGRSWPQDGSNAAVRQPTRRPFFARLSCRATGESGLEEFLCFGVVAALILARLQGHWGERFGVVLLDGFWQCRSCITMVDEVGPKMAPTQP